MNLYQKVFYYLRKNLLITIASLIILISLIAASIFYTMEVHSNNSLGNFGQAIWWVLVTITTVGYGDIVPVTAAGRFLGIIIIFTGIALVSMFTATISSIFVAQKLKEERGLKQITNKGHTIICGWNHTVEHILHVIFRKPDPPTVVMINQASEDQIQNINFKFKGRSLQYVRGDFAQEEILNRANINKAKAVIIVPDSSEGISSRSDEKTILTAFSVKAIQPKIKVFAHILDIDNEPYLKKAQVEDYIVSDAFSGVLLGEMITSPGVPQSVHNLIGLHGKEHLSRIKIPSNLIGKTFGEVIAYYRIQNILPIALVKEQKPLSFEHVLSEDYSYLDKFIEEKFKKAGRSLKKGEQLDIRINPPDETLIESESFLVVIQ